MCGPADAGSERESDRQTDRFAHTLKQTLIDMGKLFPPQSSVKVSLSAATKPRSSTKEEEYLGGYSDFFGEATKPSLPAEKPNNLARPKKLTRQGSRFGLVLERRMSLTASQMRKFGQTVTPNDNSVGDDEKSSP